MLLFLWLFITEVILGYVALYTVIDQQQTYGAIAINIVLLGWAVRLAYTSYNKKEQKDMVLFIALAVFISITTILILDF
ncbi:hypothetical protein SAMN05518683_108156 [Salibacterium halotolerans]|uniref:Uncharacterized protein n=2 Tax=Salibacterium halotolerans TaxID=1884432 RepID=A0A1I5SEX5_9BACI|nr:hypothetical protein SAMN05518683_108156 [Salibacterium halotolerans]